MVVYKYVCRGSGVSYVTEDIGMMLMPGLSAASWDS